MLVGIDHKGRAFALGDLHRRDLLGQPAAAYGLNRAALALQGEGVLGSRGIGPPATPPCTLSS
jgi:hypothetical protein